MSAKIKLARFGTKGSPSYRIVIADESAKQISKVVDTLGFYNPSTSPVQLRVDNDKLKKWIGFGAQPTPGIRKLLHL